MNIEKFKNMFCDCEISEDKIIIKNNLHDAISLVKNDLSFNLLKSITAVDLNNNKIELNYNLYSTVNDESLIISIITDNNQVETVTDLFDSAIADENEIYDMFGINFLNNNDLKRLYMPENWEGYPLRKDYVQDDTRLAWNDNKNTEA